MSEVRAVLFDADGVLQHVRHDWAVALDAVGGPGFADAVFTHELPAMRGERTMRMCLEEAVRSHSVSIDVDETLDLWRQVHTDPDAMVVVANVRAAGVREALATNQQDVRRDVMRRVYDDAFDTSFYSCEIGAAKPDEAYFRCVLDSLHLEAREVAFVDDSPRNVASAARLGIRAVIHDPGSGAAGLRRDLRESGVSLAQL